MTGISLRCLGLLVLAGSLLLFPAPCWSADRLNILDFAPPGTQVDRTGGADTSQALSNVVAAANVFTAKGEPACVYIPPGIYRIVFPPPPFVRAGCIKGDGSTQSIIKVDTLFQGDLFAWSEAWLPTTPGPTVVGIRVIGDKRASLIQNCFVFYDRNDEVFLDDIDVSALHGRVLFSGITKNTSQAYMRESHMRSLRFFEDGAPGFPVVEFSSQGTGSTDATNEIKMSQVDIYGANGPSFVIRNNGTGVVRGITADALRIEGKENGTTSADLMTIGDPKMQGAVAGITLNELELIDPYKGYAALRLTSSSNATAPYLISVQGMIGGGLSKGQGLRIDSGRTSVFRISNIHTEDTNVIIGPLVSEVVIDGNGLEATWTYIIDPSSQNGVSTPSRRSLSSAGK